MKTSSKLSILVLLLVALFTSCKKEELPEPNPWAKCYGPVVKAGTKGCQVMTPTPVKNEPTRKRDYVTDNINRK